MTFTSFIVSDFGSVWGRCCARCGFKESCPGSALICVADFFYVCLCRGCAPLTQEEFRAVVVRLLLPHARDLEGLRLGIHGFSFRMGGFDTPGQPERAALELLAWAAEHDVSEPR